MKRGLWIGAGVIVLVVLGSWLQVRWLMPPAPEQLPLAGLREIVASRTQIVPTLDTPLEEGNNALWCASWQMAWERIKDDVTDGPVRLEGDPAMAKRLNGADPVADLVEAEDAYAAAGFMHQGIADRIRRELGDRFPSVPFPDLADSGPDDAVAFAYLRASVRFKVPYPVLTEAIRFQSADGKKARVQGFGFSSDGQFQNAEARGQARILHEESKDRTSAFILARIIRHAGNEEPLQGSQLVSRQVSRSKQRLR